MRIRSSALFLCRVAAVFVVTTGPGRAAENSLDTGALTKRAVAAMVRQDWPSAKAAWEAVLKVEPDNAGVLSNLGKVEFRQENYPAAVEHLEKAVALKPTLTDSWQTLGLVHLEMEHTMMAVSCMTRAVAINPGDPRAHNSLAIVLKRIGWTTGAESELQKALDLDPGYAEAHFNLAVMYLERKPPSQEMARRHYQRAVELGAATDTVVEKQIRGESAAEVADPDEPEPDNP